VHEQDVPQVWRADDAGALMVRPGEGLDAVRRVGLCALGCAAYLRGCAQCLDEVLFGVGPERPVGIIRCGLTLLTPAEREQSRRASLDRARRR